MSLLSRLTEPAAGEVKIPIHAFMAALAELKRDAAGVDLARIAAFSDFNLDAGEQTSLQTFIDNFLGDLITRERIHDVLLLGEAGFYTVQECSDRLLTPGGSTNLIALIVQRQLEVLARSVNDYIVDGCLVSAQGSPNMTLAVAKGAAFTNGTLRAVTAANVNIGAANATKPRFDIVVIDSAGAKQVRAGTASATPQPPDLSANDVPLCFVYVAPGATAIDSAKLSNCRILQGTGPVLIGKRTTALVFSNTAAAQDYISLILPSGLMSAGKTCRVRCGGSMLLNSGTPTVTMRIAYGGTTMFQDVTASATADVDRLAWSLEFDLIAQAINDQALVGCLSMSPVGAKTAPNTGLGDIAATGPSAPFAGSSAVDSGTADRTLLLQFTMSVANAANEIALEYATAELV